MRSAKTDQTEGMPRLATMCWSSNVMAHTTVYSYILRAFLFGGKKKIAKL